MSKDDIQLLYQIHSYFHDMVEYVMERTEIDKCTFLDVFDISPRATPDAPCIDQLTKRLELDEANMAALEPAKMVKTNLLDLNINSFKPVNRIMQPEMQILPTATTPIPVTPLIIKPKLGFDRFQSSDLNLKENFYEFTINDLLKAA